MIRNFQVLSLSLVAVLALSAVAASSASATSDLTAGASSGTIKATQSTEQVFTTTPGTVRCSTANQEGTYTAATITTMELSATYAGCKAFGFLSATVNMGPCKYHLSGTNVPGTFALTIICTSGEITVSTSGCVIHVPPQNLTGHLIVVNIVGGVVFNSTFEKLKYKETSGCPNVPLGTNPTTENGTFTGGAEAKAFNTSGAQVSLVGD